MAGKLREIIQQIGYFKTGEYLDKAPRENEDGEL